MGQLLSACGTDVLGIAVLINMLYLLIRNDIVDRKKTIRYIYTVVATLVTIFLEILTKLLELFASYKTRYISACVNFSGFSLMFFIPIMLAMLYSERIYNKRKVILIPAYIGSFLSLLSIWTGWIFYIDNNGMYYRGPLFFINSLIGFYGFVIFIYSHINLAKEYDKNQRGLLWSICAICTIGTLLQIAFPDLIIMWAAISIGELLYYVFLRELQFQYDIITDVKNRNSFEYDVSHLSKNKKIWMIEFDVNDLKHINDYYGHKAGDEYLKKSANVIKKAYKTCGIVYRIGGDEFAVIAIGKEDKDIIQARENLIREMTLQNANLTEKLYIANAASCYDPKIHASVYDCLKDADIEMYNDKKKSKSKI